MAPFIKALRVVFCIDTHNGICANVSCAHYFAHVGFAQMGLAPSCPTQLFRLRLTAQTIVNSLEN